MFKACIGCALLLSVTKIKTTYIKDNDSVFIKLLHTAQKRT